ncbi:hypothetical protein MKX03_003013 [Papaver bracteatum]|nr:hypothetical protein MKX03_003013 [Papaver bracteatum]
MQLISGCNPVFFQSDSVFVKELARNINFIQADIDHVFDCVPIYEIKKEGIRWEPLKQPEEIIKTELLEHQKLGLGWLVHRESSNELPPFWFDTTCGSEKIYYSLLMDFCTKNRPQPLRGGVFADAMGSGKTLTLLSLIANDKVDITSSSTDTNVDNVGGEIFGGNGKRTTLVICPTSITSTCFKVFKFFGAAQINDPKDLQEYDIVLTTYNKISEFENLHELDWFRVILDEVHSLTDDKSSQLKAVRSLKSLRKWIVTSTPFENGLDFICSLLTFLRFEPFLDDEKHWQTLVQKSGFACVQVLMESISLPRRNDGLLKLPPKTLEISLVVLSVQERETYNELLRKVRAEVSRYIHPDTPIQLNWSQILAIVTGLRQLCDDLTLCLADGLQDISDKPILVQKLESRQSDEVCPVCFNGLSTQTIITSCGHFFCKDCILSSIYSRRDSPFPAPCPICRKFLTRSMLFHPLPDPEAGSTSTENDSSKISALIKLLSASKKEDSLRKSVVFTLFEKMIASLERSLLNAGFRTLILNGSMCETERDKAIEEFKGQGSHSAPTVLLASHQAFKTGIDLTAASRVYLFEPWMNPEVEERAVSCVHRLGQENDVKIVRLIVNDSIEEKILELQLETKKFGSLGSGQQRQWVNQFLKRLLKVQTKKIK